MMISMLSNSSPSIALQQNQLLSYFTHKITPFSLQQSLASQALYPKVGIVVLTIYDTILRQQRSRFGHGKRTCAVYYQMHRSALCLWSLHSRCLSKPSQSVIWWLTVTRRNFCQHLYCDCAIMEARLLFHDINMYITDWNCECDWGSLFYMDNHGTSARTWCTRLLSSSLM